MVALRGLLFSFFIFALATVISLLVVGIIIVTYKVVCRGKPEKMGAK